LEVINPKRSRQILIKMKTLKDVDGKKINTPPKLREAILKLKLKEDDLPELISWEAPKDDPLAQKEIKALRQYLPEGKEAANESKLVEADRFVLEMLKVPDVYARLKAMRDAAQLPKTIMLLRTQAADVAGAIKAVRDSTALGTVLKLVLEMGNVINHDTEYGNAEGVRLEVLERLGDVWTTDDSKTTLLHHIAMAAMDGDPDVATNLKDQLEQARNAMACRFAVINGNVDTVNRNLETVKRALPDGLQADSTVASAKGDRFVETMIAFLSSEKEGIEGVIRDAKKACSDLTNLAEEYCEEGRDDLKGPDVILKRLVEFSDMFAEAAVEVIARKKKREETIAAAAEDARRKAEAALGSAAQARTDANDAKEKAYRAEQLDAKKNNDATAVGSEQTASGQQTEADLMLEMAKRRVTLHGDSDDESNGDDDDWSQ